MADARRQALCLTCQREMAQKMSQASIEMFRANAFQSTSSECWCMINDKLYIIQVCVCVCQLGQT